MMHRDDPDLGKDQLIVNSVGLYRPNTLEHVCPQNPYRGEHRPRILWDKARDCENESWCFEGIAITSCPWCTVLLPRPDGLVCNCGIYQIRKEQYYYPEIELTHTFTLKSGQTYTVECQARVIKLIHPETCPLRGKEIE